MWYRNWGHGDTSSDFTPADLDVAYRNGAMPMITWQPLDGWIASADQPTYRCTNIARGDFDPFVTTWARAAKTYGKVFYLRLAHEMNGDWYPWGTAPGNANGNAPADYVAMWRHVHDLFQREGVTNVRWVWSPNAESAYARFAPLNQLYPGDAYVDWVGMDGFNFGAGSGSGWRTITQIFGPSYDTLTAMTTKPMMIAEIASGEQGGDKAAWITQGLLTDLPSRFPRVQAVVWFDANREADWRVNSSATSLTALSKVAKSLTYQGRLP